MLTAGTKYMIAEVREYRFRRFIGHNVRLVEVLEEDGAFALVEATIDGDSAHFVFWTKLIKPQANTCHCRRLDFPHQRTKLCRDRRI